MCYDVIMNPIKTSENPRFSDFTKVITSATSSYIETLREDSRLAQENWENLLVSAALTVRIGDLPEDQKKELQDARDMRDLASTHLEQGEHLVDNILFNFS